MRILWVVLVTVLFTTVAAANTTADCEAQAVGRKLQGAAKASFIGGCAKDTKRNSTTSALYAAERKCSEKATEKKLGRVERETFIKKCVNESGAAPAPSCEEQAREKKLQGVSKQSFMIKCMKTAKK